MGKDDPTFKYDKRIDFKPQANAEADWDESDDGKDAKGKGGSDDEVDDDVG